MAEAVLEYYIHNDKILKSEEFEGDYKDIYPSVYEVIRIIDGIPVFLEEHYERLVNSSKLLNYTVGISFDYLKSKIEKAARLNSVKNYNIKIVVNNLENDLHDEYYYFIKSSYPDAELYKNGISTFSYNAERQNPNAKVINKSMRDEINRKLAEKNCYEALLVNRKNEITEGSRSNAFFIKNEQVYTAPADDVLLGITRQRIITLCAKNGIKVNELPICLSELSGYDAAFISGTSPKVLPIKNIDQIQLSVEGPLLRRIIEIYDAEIIAYIKGHK